jgi:hypothetical protein
MCEHKWMCKPYCLIKWIMDKWSWYMNWKNGWMVEENKLKNLNL